MIKTYINIKYDEHGTIDTLPKVNKLSNFKDDTDLLTENQFNLHKMNLNRWNYGKSDFAHILMVVISKIQIIMYWL